MSKIVEQARAMAKRVRFEDSEHIPNTDVFKESADLIDALAAEVEKLEALSQPVSMEPEFIKHEVDQPYDWSEWVCPEPKSYLLKCCDCGLVHEAQFGVVRYKAGSAEDCEHVDDKNLQAVFRMRRSEQWTPTDMAYRPGGLAQPASMEPVAWVGVGELDRLRKRACVVEISRDKDFDDDVAIYTQSQLAAARQQGAEEERKKHCACQWDGDDNRTHTCVRHQGWLDVIEEWSSRAKDAEKCEDAYAKRIADLEKSNAVLLEALKEAEYALDYAADMTKPEGLSGCDCPICSVAIKVRAAIQVAEVKP